MKSLLPECFEYLPFQKNSAQSNMALDELLYLLAQEQQRAFFRVYGWKSPAISLGFFQKIAHLDQEKTRRYALPIVRRMTGGRAVLHSCEITFAFAFPLHNSVLASRKDILLEISRIIVAGLRVMGCDACISNSSYGNLRNPSCFESRVLHEIIDASGKKLCGMAMLIKDQTLLLQGTIPLNDEYTNIRFFLRPSAEVLEESCQLSTLSPQDSPILAQFLLGIKEQTKLSLPRELSAAQLHQLDSLIQQKYANPSWIAQR